MEKRTGPKATPSNRTFKAINSKSAHAKPSTINNEQKQLPQENTLKRRRATLLGTAPFEELTAAPVFKPVLGTPVSKPVLSTSVSKPAPSTPKLEADVSGPYFKTEYTSPYAMPGAQDPDVKVEGQDTRKKITRVSQACDMCHDRKTKASVAVRSTSCL